MLGHAQCSGIAAAMCTDTHYEATPFLSEWVELLQPALDRCGGSNQQTAVEYESIRLSLERLLSFPFIPERVKQGRLELAGAHFKISDGTLTLLDQHWRHFWPVEIDGQPQ